MVDAAGSRVTWRECVQTFIAWATRRSTYRPRQPRRRAATCTGACPSGRQVRYCQDRECCQERIAELEMVVMTRSECADRRFSDVEDHLARVATFLERLARSA